MGLLTNGGPQQWHPASENLKQICAEAAKYCKVMKYIHFCLNIFLRWNLQSNFHNMWINYVCISGYGLRDGLSMLFYIIIIFQSRLSLFFKNDWTNLLTSNYYFNYMQIFVGDQSKLDNS